MITVLVADDQEVVRAGLVLILEAQDDIAVVAQAADGQGALDAVADADPDVVLMDIRMPLIDGIEATRRLVARGSRSRILVLTTYGLDEYVYEALRAGASGFLLKTDSPKRLVDAVRTVAAGESMLGPDTTRLLIERFITGPHPNQPLPPPLKTLTDRELEVLTLLAQGLSNAEAAAALCVGEGTVKTHVARILAKLGLRDRVQAVVVAFETGLINPGSTHGRGPRSP